MKTKLISILLCLAFIFSLCACDESNYKNDVATKDLADKIVAAIASPHGFASPDSDFVEFNMEGAAALCDDYCVMLSGMNINMNEFGIFRAKSESDAEALAKICQTYVDLKIEGYNPHYLPEEYPKIQNGTVKIYGTYVVYTFLTNEDMAKVEKIMNEILAQ
jgi:hypothetical protein